MCLTKWNRERNSFVSTFLWGQRQSYQTSWNNWQGFTASFELHMYRDAKEPLTPGKKYFFIKIEYRQWNIEIYTYTEGKQKHITAQSSSTLFSIDYTRTCTARTQLQSGGENPPPMSNSFNPNTKRHVVGPLRTSPRLCFRAAFRTLLSNLPKDDALFTSLLNIFAHRLSE